MAGRVPTILTRLVLDNKKFRATLKRTGRQSAQDFKRAASTALVAVTALTAGLASARREWVKVTDAAALAAGQFGTSVKDIARRSEELKRKGVSGDAEEIASAFDLMAKLGVENVDTAHMMIVAFSRLADATGGELLPTIGDVGNSLLAMGRPLEDVIALSDSYTFVARQTTVGVGEFTAFLQENREALREQNMGVQDAAAALYLLEQQGHRGGAAISTLTAGIQGATDFQAIWTDQVGVSQTAVRELAEQIDTLDAATSRLTDAVHANDDGWKQMGAALRENAWVPLGEGVGILGDVIASLFGLRQEGEDVRQQIPEIFQHISGEAALMAAFTTTAVESMTGIAQTNAAPLEGALVAPWEAAKAAAEAAARSFADAIDAARASGGTATLPGGGTVTFPAPIQPLPPNLGIPGPPGNLHPGDPNYQAPAAPQPSRPLDNDLSRGFWDAYVAAGYDREETAKRLWGRGSSYAEFKSVFGDLVPFAAGGIVDRPTMGLVGEAGPEAIVPLDRLGGLIGEGLSASRSAVATRDFGSPSGGSGNGGANVTIVIHEARFADASDLLRVAQRRGLGL